MGKRKTRRPSPSDEPETLTPKLEEEDEDVTEKGGNGFFACYLLTSLSPRHKGQTYIGFTVNPRRRIRQHNGEIGCGALRTKKKRPWEMVLCIYGFPTNVAALQFEWAWQHPVESLAVRKAAVEFKSLNGLANKIKLAYTMLTLPSWQSLNLTVNFFSTKYTKHYAGCPSLPNQMKVQVRSMDELPCYTGVVDMDEKDLWDDYEDFDGTAEANGSLEEEGIENATIAHDSSDPQNSVKESAPENSPRQPSGSPVQSEERIKPFCSAEKRFSLFSNGSYSGIVDVADRGRSPSVEECAIELDSPAAQTYLLSTIDNDRRPVKCSAEHCKSQSIEECTIELDSPAVQTFPLSTADNDQRPADPCSIEVIDVFSPSPEYSSLGRKKRSASSVCPQIIDLTQSPIYV